MKYLHRPRFYVDKAQTTAYERFVHDAASIDRAEEEKFAALRLDSRAAVARLDEVLQCTRSRGFDFDNDSIHWLLFAAFSADAKAVQRILELGTFDAEFTQLLSLLFPDAEIVTVDLPDTDPLLRALYNRADGAEYRAYQERRRARLEAPNVRPVETNTFFLLDAVNGPFDLVWVDAGHLYPEVAWDLANAYHLCRPEGRLLCDDVIPSTKPYRDAYVSTESWEVLEYLAAREPVSITLFLKRRLPHLYRQWTTRKYVACFSKPSAERRD